jgi:RHS repeat-associated protein
VDPLLDPETGFQYDNARYYDPNTGQFLTSDPLEAITQQPYAYAGDDPINETDPTGLDDTIPVSAGPYSGQSAAGAGARLDAYCQQNPNASICTEGALPSPGQIAGAVGTFVGNHYGQIAEGLAGVGCIAGLQPELCIIATGAAGITSEIQNATSSCPSVAGGLIDLLGLAPGLQVAGADAAGLLGAGKTAGNVFSGIVGGSAIVGGPAAVQLARQQDGATQSSCGCQ